MPREITLETIRDAEPAVYTVARRTPLVTFDPLTPNGRGNADPATRIYLKLESLQTIGSFKIRGAARYFPGWQASFVDGCGGKSVIPTMWPLLRDAVAASIVVSLDEIKQAVRRVATGARVIAKGAGACAVAAALSGRAGSGTIVAVVSGVNIDRATFARIITEGDP